MLKFELLRVLKVCYESRKFEEDVITMMKTSKQIELSTVTHVTNCRNEMTIKELGLQISCPEIGWGLNVSWGG